MQRVVWVALVLVILVGVGVAAEFADFDEDGVVGFNDFVQFAQRYDSVAGDGVYESRYDVNGDGRINFGDYALFAEVFGQPVHADKVPISWEELEVLALTLKDKGEYAQALAKLQEFVEHARTPQDQARGLHEIATVYFDMGDKGKAREAHTKVLNRFRHSDIPAVRHQVIWSSIKLGELQESETALVLYLEYAKSLTPAIE